MTIAAAIKQLQSYDPATHCAFMLWMPEDVTGLEEGKGLTGPQVNEVLDRVHRCADAQYGITWDHLREAIGDIKRESDDE